MKKLILALTIIFAVAMLASCAEPKTINGTTYQPAGWMEGYEKEDCVKYRVNSWNVVWSVILVETIFAPILITGEQLWEPIGWKDKNPSCDEKEDKPKITEKSKAEKEKYEEVKSILTPDQEELAKAQKSSIGPPPSMGLPEGM